MDLRVAGRCRAFGIVICAVSGAVLIASLINWQNERRACRQLKSAGVRIDDEYQGPSWISVEYRSYFPMFRHPVALRWDKVKPGVAAGVNLAALSHVRSLIIDECVFDNGDVEALVTMQHIRCIFVRNCPLSGRVLAKLHTLSRLEVLELKNTGILDADVDCLATLRRLRTLALDGDNITDRAMASIGRIRSLETLRISGTRVTDAGIFELASCPNLALLALRDVAGLSAAGISELKRKLPGCLVKRTASEVE